MELEELINNYQVTGDPNKFHDDLVIYHTTLTQKPILSDQTEKHIRDTIQLKICKEHNMGYKTFLENLEMLIDYRIKNNG